jgi:cytoskeletal protein RodZ
MYGLKEGIDLSFLTGRVLIQVAVGLYQVIFAFDEHVTISVEGSYQLHNEDGTSIWSPGATSTAAPALSLLGATVTNARGESNGTLTITFSGKESLVIMDSSEKFESYQITKPGTTIVV